MAKSKTIWGIDLGNNSLKALRCRADSEANGIVAEAFDYIEYPKILTRPDAEPFQSVASALQQFLSRHDLRGAAAAISVAGQNGLARFIKLEAVEAQSIPSLIEHHAKEQIPFDLNEVVWDYQRMRGAREEKGVVLQGEVALVAMKRDQVLRALEPFRNAGIKVGLVQLAPLALCNFLVFDQLTGLPPEDQYDADAPPAFSAILSLGTDASDLVVTNGFRVWQRSIPVGGSLFTKALVKELKLSFDQAERLKRNATTAPDPKPLFQAMRPVFNELLTEVQRSIRYFTTIDRAAGIQRMVATGRGMKLPGLRRFLAQGLGIEVDVPESYRQMTGADVLSAPAFKENCLCFPVCYGLALQGMNRSAIRTNLVPGNAVLNRVSRGLARAGRWIATGFQRVGDRTPKRAKPATIAEHETRPCARCRKAYSAKMNSCPHCGAPLAQAHKPAEQAATVATASHLSGRKPEQITDAQIMAFQAVRADGNMTIHFRCPVCGDTFQFAPNETAVQTASDLLEEGGFTITCQCKRELRMRAAGPEMIVALNAVVSRRGGVSYLS